MEMAHRRNYDALHAMAVTPGEFLNMGRFPRGVGIATLTQLVSLGWAEERDAIAAQVERAWRISAAGARLIGRPST